MNDKIMTIPEVASFLKLSEAKVYLLCQSGEMPHIKLGRNIRVWESELLAWLEKQAVKNGI